MKQPSQVKHPPVRTCVVCRTKDSKRSLVRLVRSEAGVKLDPTGKANGRGAYLCESESCWERAIVSDILNHALRTALTEEDRERLRQARPRS
jgi:hypothetical protein